MRMLAVTAALILAGAAPARTPVPSFQKPAHPTQCRHPDPQPVIPKTAAPNSSYLAARQRVPDRYRTGTVRAEVEMASAEEINATCAGGVPVCGSIFYACLRGKKMLVPNPCDYPETDAYAALLCHEAAHLRGWPATHGD